MAERVCITGEVKIGFAGIDGLRAFFGEQRVLDTYRLNSRPVDVSNDPVVLYVPSYHGSPRSIRETMRTNRGRRT